MACGSCGGGAINSPLHSSALVGQQPTVADQQYQYEVTFPNGKKEVFDFEAEAYRATRLTGGGIRRKLRE